MDHTTTILKNPIVREGYINRAQKEIADRIIKALNTEEWALRASDRLYNKMLENDYESFSKAQRNIITRITDTQQILHTHAININEPALALTSKICATSSIRYSVYLYVLKHYSIIEELSNTNPGILTMYILTQNLNEVELDHPSVIVKAMREHMQDTAKDYDLTDYWKALTKRSHQSIFNHYAACMVNNLTTSSTTASELLILTTQYERELNINNSAWLKNITSNRFTELPSKTFLLKLLIKEIDENLENKEAMDALAHEISDIIDYAVRSQSRRSDQQHQLEWCQAT